MTDRFPPNGEEVEVFVDGEWRKATFLETDSFRPADEDCDEVWLIGYFRLENGDTVPVQDDLPLPAWRPLSVPERSR
ncbi:MAG: hypothetical protein JO288_05095 [Hyphomicrobiales bacterium]|nr:hypothetical protein [Hyphomicrobiales bacterium]